ncbi:MAG TPA: hypothetical protein VL134_07460 [Leptolyngbya sp.]|jgi:hypothetical protein|nr:hypothetical protein [Leptolyngbya sp.]
MFAAVFLDQDRTRMPDVPDPAEPSKILFALFAQSALMALYDRGLNED